MCGFIIKVTMEEDTGSDIADDSSTQNMKGRSQYIDKFDYR